MNMRELMDLVLLNEAAVRIENPNKSPPYLTLLKNPRSAELLRFMQSSHDDATRGVILPDGIYFWHGEDAIHEQVEKACGYDPDEEIYPRLIIMKYYHNGDYSAGIQDMALHVDPARMTDEAMAYKTLLRAIDGLSIEVVR